MTTDLNFFQSTINQNRFDQLVTTSDWWDWAEATIVNQLRVAAMYNGQPPYGLRGYIGIKLSVLFV